MGMMLNFRMSIFFKKQRKKFSPDFDTLYETKIRQCTTILTMTIKD